MFKESTSASSCGMVTKAKLTMRTDNEAERTANWTVDVDRITPENDSMTRDDELMIEFIVTLSCF